MFRIVPGTLSAMKVYYISKVYYLYFAKQETLVGYITYLGSYV